MKRRDFLVKSLSASGALIFNLRLTPDASAMEIETELHSWVVISPGNRVTVRIPQPEIGQGATTTLMQLLAEELDLDLKLTDWQFYDPGINRQRDNVYVHTAAITSWSATRLFIPMRIARAQIRRLLLNAASRQLAVDVADIVIEQHELVHPSSGRRIGFSSIAQEASDLPLPKAVDVVLKPPARWRYIGHPIPRNDAMDKCTGKAQFGIDVSLPGMKYAAIAQCPVFGGRLKSFDASSVSGDRGIIAVLRVNAGPSGRTAVAPLPQDDWQMDDSLAVVADGWWQASEALEKIAIQWDEGKNSTDSSTAISGRLKAEFDQKEIVIEQHGDAAAVLNQNSDMIVAEYASPFLEHAAMEPMNCTALYDDGRLEVWAPTQHGDEALLVASNAAGVDVTNTFVHLMMAGGGFGRRLHNDYVSQVSQIARQLPGIPIKMIWSREETTRRGYYPPAAIARFRGVLNENNRIDAWHSRIVTGRSSFQAYGMTRFSIPAENRRVSYATIDTPPGFGFLRGVGHAQMFWMNHGFLCELAEKAGQDSLSFQLEQMVPEALPPDYPDRADVIDRLSRLRSTLEGVVSLADRNWSQRRGRGRGFAVHDMSYMPGWSKSCVAVAVDVELTESGKLLIDHVYASVNCGLVLNPDVAQAQIEGGVIFGLSNALHGRITLEHGRVQQSNFHDYPIMRMIDAPQITTRFIPSNEPPQGIGESAVPVVIAALLDAVFAAGGPRVRELPISLHALALVTDPLSNSG